MAYGGCLRRPPRSYPPVKESNFLPLRRCGIAVHQGEAWFGRTAFLQALRSQIALEPGVTSTWLDEPVRLTAR